MGLDKEGLQRQCEAIMKSRRVKNKIVVLCEGKRPDERHPSPQSYSRLEQMPDASFYKACVPRSKSLPEFFNCGDRKDVLDSWQKLFQQTPENNELIFALLIHISRVRDSLILEIGKFYSRQEATPDNHIPFFLETIYSVADKV